jgi:hypothetical protein
VYVRVSKSVKRACVWGRSGRPGQKLAVYRQRLLLSFESLNIGTNSVEKMRTFGPGLEPLGKEGGWGDKELQQRREKREEDVREGINGMHQCVCQPVQLYMYLYLDVSRRAYDQQVGVGDPMQCSSISRAERKEASEYRLRIREASIWRW